MARHAQTNNVSLNIIKFAKLFLIGNLYPKIREKYAIYIL